MLPHLTVLFIGFSKIFSIIFQLEIRQRFFYIRVVQGSGLRNVNS